MLASLAQSASSSGEGAALFFPLLLGWGSVHPRQHREEEGYSFGWFYVFGVLFFIIALIVALSMKDKTLRSPSSRPLRQRSTRRCPSPRRAGPDPWAAGRSD
jgi:hypothetical protein